MSFSSRDKLWATEEPTWPAPSMTIFNSLLPTCRRTWDRCPGLEFCGTGGSFPFQRTRPACQHCRRSWSVGRSDTPAQIAPWPRAAAKSNISGWEALPAGCEGFWRSASLHLHDGNFTRSAQYQQPSHQVAQLTDIAGPAVIAQGGFERKRKKSGRADSRESETSRNKI